jgi:hypothetical protein
MITMQQARFCLDAQLLERGKTFADVDDWIVDLCEAGDTVIVYADIGGATLVSSFAWPKGERFNWRAVTMAFVHNKETVH